MLGDYFNGKHKLELRKCSRILKNNIIFKNKIMFIKKVFFFISWNDSKRFNILNTFFDNFDVYKKNRSSQTGMNSKNSKLWLRQISSRKEKISRIQKT